MHGFECKQDRPSFILESHCIDFPCSFYLKSMIVCSEIMCDYIFEKYDKELLELYITKKLKTYLIEKTDKNKVTIDESFYFSVNSTISKVELFVPLIISEPAFYEKYFLGFVIIGIMFFVIFIMLFYHRWSIWRKRKNPFQKHNS